MALALIPCHARNGEMTVVPQECSFFALTLKLGPDGEDVFHLLREIVGHAGGADGAFFRGTGVVVLGRRGMRRGHRATRRRRTSSGGDSWRRETRANTGIATNTSLPSSTPFPSLLFPPCFPIWLVGRYVVDILWCGLDEKSWRTEKGSLEPHAVALYVRHI